MAVPHIVALGSTILHSLWQATLLAGLLWLISRQPRLPARSRYAVAYGLLLLQCVLSIGTFLHYRTPNSRIEAAVRQAMVDFVALPTASAPAVDTLYTPEFWMAALVSCWVLAMAVGSIRLSVSLWQVKGLRRTAGANLPAELEHQVRYLAGRIGYFGPLCLRASDAVGAPLLVGHLKPMLLFPVALVNQLSTEESETVILHELAHLRRYDHWFNLLQCLIEVVFYYHPAVHWIGARIREEREHCCDDLVLRYGPGRLPYARALLHFGNATAATPATLSLTDGGGLLGRVRRFLNQQEISYRMKSRILLLPVLAAIVLVATAAYVPALSSEELSALEMEPTSPAPIVIGGAETLVASIDTLPRGNHQVTKISDGKTTRLRVEDGEIKEFELEGRQIPEEQFPDYEDEAEELLGTDRKPSGRVFIAGDDDFSFGYSPEIYQRLGDLEDLDFNFDFEEMHEALARVHVNLDSLGGRLRGIQFDALDGDVFLDQHLLDSVYTRSLDGMQIFRHRLENIDGIDNLEELEKKEKVLEEALEQLEKRKEALRQQRGSQGEAMIEQVRARREHTMAMARQKREALQQRRHAPPALTDCPQAVVVDGAAPLQITRFSQGTATRLGVGVPSFPARSFGGASLQEPPVILYELRGAEVLSN